MPTLQVMVFGLEGLRPDEYDKVENPEGVCRLFSIDDSRPVDLQVRNRIYEYGNDADNFQKLTPDLWLHKDLEVVPVDDSNERFRVQLRPSLLDAPDKEAADEDREVGSETDPESAIKAIQGQIESVNAMLTLTYSVLADSEDMFTAMAATAWLYLRKLTDAGFKREEAFSIVSAYMTDINQAMHRKAGQD